MKPECIECGDPFNPRRLALGYYTCLECGAQAASHETKMKARRTAPAYNKGAYMYITSRKMTKEIGK
jgi:ribosomal protein L37AE/L43A